MVMGSRESTAGLTAPVRQFIADVVPRNGSVLRMTQDGAVELANTDECDGCENLPGWFAW